MADDAPAVTGRWTPIPVQYAVAVFPFEPLVYGREHGRLAGQAVNPHQVALALGDEIYVLEQYVSSDEAASIWLRGYVVSSARPSSAAFTGASDAMAAALEEPSVYIGLFPAAHIAVREQLEASDERIVGLMARAPSALEARPHPLLNGRDETQGGYMAPLQEEDEPETSPAGSPRSGFGHSRTRTTSGHLRRASIGSGFALAGFDSRRLSSVPTLPTNGHIEPPPPSDPRPPLPLPSLKCGDETAAGADEPLIDEIACALREWTALLYVHLARRDYALFATVKAHAEALHAGRRALLAGALSSGEEGAALRAQLVDRLVRGNAVQSLDLLVRHPRHGGLVEVDAGDDPVAAISPSWVSGVRMYAMQVALAYSAAAPDAASNAESASRGQPDYALSALAGVQGGSATPAQLAAPRRTLEGPGAIEVGGSTLAAARLHRVQVDVRALVASLAGPGEIVELALSLFNKTDARFVTEEFAVLLNHNGAPLHEDRIGRIRTVFVDLSAHDVQDALFLVCRIVRNGAMRADAALSVPETVSRPPTPGEMTGGEDAYLTMVGPANSARQTVRRPFGCAVLDISDLVAGLARSDPTSATAERQMPIFVPVAESAFSTLHEDIISSRTRELERHPRADHVAVRVRASYADNGETLEASVVPTLRLGFPDVVEPALVRNNVYVKLWSFDTRDTTTGARNIEVAVEIRRRDGAVVERAISRGAGEPLITQYNSMVFRANNTPTFGELLKIDMPADLFEHCHIFFTFRHRGGKTAAGSGTAGSGGGGPDRPFGFAFLPLFPDGGSFAPDGTHSLMLYKWDRSVTAPTYLECPHAVAGASSALSRTMTPLRDVLVIRSFLCSTTFTQNATLLKLLRCETVLLPHSEELQTTLAQLKYCSESEIAKHIRPVLDALFGILASAVNQSDDYSSLIFANVVTILGIVADRRFLNFRPVLETYIDGHFAGSTAWSHILRSLQSLLTEHATDATAAQTLRSALKVWAPLMRLVVRSREIQRTRNVGMGATSEHLDAAFKREVRSVVRAATALMGATTPASVIGTQTLVVQHFASILPSLARIFTADELLELTSAFTESVQPLAARGGKTVVWKLLLLIQLANGVVFDAPESRAALVPAFVRWVKPHLGRFDATAPGVKDGDAARVAWLESMRLAVSAVATLLDRLHGALADRAIRTNRVLLAQEQDNVEYVLSLLPRLLDAYRELELPANLTALERHKSAASIVATVPTVFPASYPFSVLVFPPPSVRAVNETATAATTVPTLRHATGEVGCVIIVMLLLAPPSILRNYLDGVLEIEGADSFARAASALCRVGVSVLENKAWPRDWLNLNVLAHAVLLKLALALADVLERTYVPDADRSFAFDFALWKDAFALLLRLLASDQLCIEDFSPQRRRAVWRLAGDLRGTGAKLLGRLWDTLGWPQRYNAGGASSIVRLGGYQIQLGPGLVEPILELCLSHHDELRATAVNVLFALVVNEWSLNGSFDAIQSELIDKLDKLFSVRRQNDLSVSRAFFLQQLRELFDTSPVITPELRERLDIFLESVSEFLDLLLGIRSLPETDEFVEDRVVGTLKLMSFVRGVSSSPIYIRYIVRLHDYHLASSHFTEAGLTLKLHADLYDWQMAAFLEPMPEFDLPRQSEFARKETLYLQILDLLNKGRAWETAIALCKELQVQYELHTFSYQRLSELLAHQATLYGNIVNQTRQFPSYFRVGYYGRGFPISVQNKQFVCSGAANEKLSAFCERMQNKHPNATLVKSSAPVSDEVQFSDGQFLQITAVTPEPDRTTPVFTNPDVPTAVRAYYEANGTSCFSFRRPFERAETSIARVQNEYLRVWIEKTFLICAEAFPTVLRRSEVLELRVVEFSPIENALQDVDAKRTELESLERRYLVLLQTDDAKVNSTPLASALNAALDTGHADGVPMYRQAFFGAEFVSAHPDKARFVGELQTAIERLVRAIDRAMRLHARICPAEMRSFHRTLEGFFERNFADERARLPVSSTEPASLDPIMPHASRAINFPLNSSTGSSAASQRATAGLAASSLAQRSRGASEATVIGSSGERFTEALARQPMATSPTHHGADVDPASIGRSDSRASRASTSTNRLSVLGAKLTSGIGSIRRRPSTKT